MDAGEGKRFIVILEKRVIKEITDKQVFSGA